MGKPSPPDPALLFTGILYSDSDVILKAKEYLLDSFGREILQTPPSNWNYSDYYEKELGSKIMRTFIFFKNLISPDEIVNIKLRTNGMEEAMSENGIRKLNIDPGYLTLSSVVLATTKNYSHRIYLGKGIYGEVTLIYKDKTFVPHMFTYADYQDKTSIEMFLRARAMFKEILDSKRDNSELFPL